MAERESTSRRRTVATRVLLSYALVTIAFALMAAWSVLAQRSAAREADLMRRGYLPLALALRDTVALQDRWNAQLNHVTDAKNPADKRVWFDLTMKAGRPKMFEDLHARIADAFVHSDDPDVRSIGRELDAEAKRVEEYLAGDRELLARLFESLDALDGAVAKSRRDELVLKGNQGKKRLSALETRVGHHVDALLEAAQRREHLAIRLLVGLAVFGVLVGVLMALYARRVLAPLAAVTARARAVASGDLAPRPVVASSDEIGELAATFESMVAAIAKANSELVAAERLATIGKMAAHVTHEIRNPLSSIALNLELLEEELPPNVEAKNLTHAIQGEVERLTQLSQEYLSVARRRDLRLEREDVGEIVREAHDFMKRDLAHHGVSSEVVVREGSPHLRVDEAQLKQALWNLMRNAREAMPDGGKIAVTVGPLVASGAEIAVDDEGPGIDETARERLFEPFFTTKGHGTGLGLAITRQIVEAHGGTLECEPRAEGGTRFRITLPGTGP